MRLVSIAVLAALALPASADDFTPMLQDFLDTEIRTWSDDPILVTAIMAQNARHDGITADQIDALDRAWRAEIGQADTPTITPVIDNSAADFLRRHVESGGGAIAEIFIMDAHGLNVAATAPTSDMWQGDEAKFTETYPKGPDATHFSEVEFDESSQTFVGQISIPIVNRETGEVVGAMTVGVNAETLM
ncbi:MAG: hypothetical protein CML66_09340 [Rhodobacteraceae bacterium]|nr:hypothetical protein [Paracoccaceae bacterium]MAY47381.1 hypothetical protein [Paracoccaceae bacterium]QEW18541.1 hypothetical protein LA6_000707 [Marinibacterium anthonyi]